MADNKIKKYKASLNQCVSVGGSVLPDKSYLYNLLKKSVITEKTAFVSEIGKLFFDVDIDVSKKDIAEAVSSIYGVDVISVNTLIRKGKLKKFKGREGCRSDIKRAYVTLKKDTNIDVFAGIK